MEDSTGGIAPMNVRNASVSVAESVDVLVHRHLSDPFALDKARLYVVPIDVVPVDVAPGVLTSDGEFSVTEADIQLVDQDVDPYRLLRRTRHHRPVAAACLVATGWCAPFSFDDDICATAPSDHPQRRRVRLSIAISAAGIASVLRHDDDPDAALVLGNRGMGDLPDVLDAWWSSTRSAQ